MCDVPLISHRGENGETTQMWNGLTNSGRNKCNSASWEMYPKEQARLLNLIFRKLQKDSKFHVVFICNGAYASRTTISDKSTKCSFHQIVVGPISRPKLSTENVKTRLTVRDEELGNRYLIQQEIPVGATKSQQYCTLELVPHPLGASSSVKFYMQLHSEARLILGPIIGRVTPRTARILIELDRPVFNFACTLLDPATSQR
ncbi:hypothetical protein PHMEG_0007996 [Phytophthora megakarya]|uniref:Uncharacterized protein n=1 Tax=Phytophthora megakarya TaxID=4795 RepID=A0A225WJV9_9STRA|nr:hypothetical protein PHMEG_0007996 [Phytophthora megakarya]